MKYRKKSVVVNAFQMTEECELSVTDWPEWAREAWHRGAKEGGIWLDEVSNKFFCGTLEGVHAIVQDDWIIQGVQGEIYPCKPDIFEATYEIAE